MKVLAIKGKNLASLEDEFDIDFTIEPLKSAGIFAITGSTGSGKSTLLDALCLALFDDMPRTNRASENVQIADVKEKTINQRDSRTILRRGSSDGYSEVDFLSLSNEKYRSRWSVRRSRNKVDGSLQSSEFKLINLTTNSEEQGTKTELLAKVVELIGLTFDQFTRAVLLAQGDFATFLKATQKEKAELLEKLTGTDIYSRISVTVYEKSKVAEQDLNLLKERIKDIELLPEEEIDKLSIERQTVAEDIKVAKKNTEKLAGKIKWITDERDLNGKLQEAGQKLSETENAIEEAKSRYDYLALIDSVQEIRDSFNELRNTRNKLIENKQILAEQEKQRRANTLLLAEENEKVAHTESELQKYNQCFSDIEPVLKQARELDIQLVAAKLKEADTEKEFQQSKKAKLQIEKSIETTQHDIRTGTELISQIDDWFEINNQYKDIIPRTELILTLLTDAMGAKNQGAINAKTLTDSSVLLDKDMASIKTLEEEAKRLNKLLPAEIAELRAQLTEGEPCPVCGSLHHPSGKLSGEKLEEAEIDKAKKAISEKIEMLTGRIGSRRNENIRLKSLIESSDNQYREAIDKLEIYLSHLNQWKADFEKGTLVDSLKTISEEWGNKELIRSETHSRLTNLTTQLQLETKRLEEVSVGLTQNELKYNTAKDAVLSIKEKRESLFDGQNADEVEKIYKDKIKELTDSLTKLNQKKNGIVAANEKQEGLINRLSQEVESLTIAGDQLQNSVNEWLVSKNGEITQEQLSDLLSKTNQWIIAEREALNQLRQSKITAKATFSERNKNLENHHKDENKPSEEETEDCLRSILSGIESLLNDKATRSAEIDVSLENQRKGKERIKQFEKELNEKGLLSENWKKLNDLFGSADGAKFKVLAQGYTLDVLLSYANKHLQELSKRYEIQRISETLALQVIDLDMLGEVRTVHSLSGGESFLISLALALGLSSLSSNRMKVESLFIDEGFGSLDADTLRVAMDALERLQTQGRKIGVISHVAEMTERVTTQIHIEKMVNGKSRIEIKG